MLYGIQWSPVSIWQTHLHLHKQTNGISLHREMCCRCATWFQLYSIGSRFVSRSFRFEQLYRMDQPGTSTGTTFNIEFRLIVFFCLEKFAHFIWFYVFGHMPQAKIVIIEKIIDFRCNFSPKIKRLGEKKLCVSHECESLWMAGNHFAKN